MHRLTLLMLAALVLGLLCVFASYRVRKIHSVPVQHFIKGVGLANMFVAVSLACYIQARLA